MTCTRHTQMRSYRLTWVLAVVAILPAAVDQSVYADERVPRADSDPVCETKFGETCGAYTMYAALQLIGKQDASLYDLISPSYISTAKGSTAGDLIGMAEHYDVPAVGFTGWRSAQLGAQEYPAILEVRRNTSSRDYNHWVMVYPTGSDSYLLIDPPFEPRTVSGREIASRWRGRGVLVGGGEAEGGISSLGGIVTGPGVILVLLIVLALSGYKWTTAGIAGGHVSFVRRPGMMAVGQAGAIVVLVSLLAVVYHMTDDFGLLRNRDAALAIQTANAAVFMDRVDYAGLSEEIKRGAIVIDARQPADYAINHVSGAISLSVSLGDEERRSITELWSKDARIVVYCQSVGCDYDERVATAMVREGFTNVALYKGGWVDWQSHQPQQVSISQ